MNVATHTLREQNRLQTGAAIHETTYLLVKQQGLSTTSIDDIAKAASVSRRTFFNYYTSKEHALYGLMRPILPQTAIADFRKSRDPMLLRCTQLILSAYRLSVAHGSTPERRKEIRDQYPEVRTKLEVTLVELEQLVEPVIAEFHKDESTIALLIYAAGAVLRYCRQADPNMSDSAIRTAITTLHIITKGAKNE